MKLLKSKYDLTIREVSILFETDDLSILKLKRWVPGVLLRRHYERFMIEFSELFNKNEVANLLTEDIYRFKIILKVNNILFPLYQGLALELLLNRELPDFRKIYADVMGRPYNGNQDLKAIIKEIERLKSKLAEASTPVQRVTGHSKMSFEQVIANTEMILDRTLPRDMKLFEFKKQYDLAVLRAKEYEKLKHK